MFESLEECNEQGPVCLGCPMFDSCYGDDAEVDDTE